MLLRRWLAPVLAVGLLAVAADADAGTLTLRDEAQIFTPADTAQLRSIVTTAPFDARLVTTTNYADQAGFSRFVGMLVSEPNMVVVGIDPQHHHVQVHFGTGSHIPEADWPAIERAGNDAFKRSAWEEGGADIFRAASSAVTTGGSRVTTPVTSPSDQAGGSFLGVGLLIMLVVGVLLAVVLVAVFRRRSSPGYGSVPYGGGAPFPGGGGPYYGPGGTRGAMGPLGGGLIGAGLGGLAGYELGKMEGEREQRGFDGGGFDAGSGGSSPAGNGSFDAGGGGSSWDDSGSSGGGGSDFGGGGGDFGGGGGGDSGGGGSDF
jgi:hypothetical protein